MIFKFLKLGERERKQTFLWRVRWRDLCETEKLGLCGFGLLVLFSNLGWVAVSLGGVNEGLLSLS